MRVSDCLPPCLVSQVRISEGMKIKHDFTAINLVFNNKVRVRKTTVDELNFLTSLNFFGSNLGLWPGLGVFQMLEWMVGTFSMTLLKKIRQCSSAIINRNINN